MEHNGGNDINGSVEYNVGSPSELSCGLMEGNNMGLKKGPWTAVEDRILMEYVSKHGEGNWNAVQKNSGLKRCGKSCRLRWANHLRPNLKKGQFTPEEERLILELHAKYGNKWARMASQLPGRTDNEIKNYWNTRVKKRSRKGLPLYPHDINPSKRVCHSLSYSQENTMGVTQLAPNTIPHADTNFSFQSQASSSQHQSQLPPRLSQTRHNPTVSTLDPSLPLYDPTTSVPSFDFNHNAPMLGVPLGYKRYQEDIGFSPPTSLTTKRNSSMLRTSSMPEIASCQQFARGSSSMHDISSFHFQTQASNESFLPLPRTSNQFNFGDSLSSPSRSIYSMSSEHPSRQVSLTPEPPSYHVSQTPQLPSSQASQTQSFLDSNTTYHANINATHCSDEFLEQLLQEAEAFGYGSHLIRKPIGHLDSYEKYDLDGYGHSLASITMDSSLLEMKPTQDNDEHITSIPKYLARVFSFNSSTELMSNSNGEMKPTQDNDEHITSIPKYLARAFSFNSSTELMSNLNDEMKPSQDLEHMNSIPKYLSKLLSFNLSTEQVPNSHNGESMKLPNSQSSGVLEANLEFDMQHHMDSLFPAANSWDNMAETSVEVS